ncbi:MAG: hypothetical protein ACRC2R_16160 [Xenococcaceae cyanobacterium]
MIQAKFSLEESQIQFLEQCKIYGFKDKSLVVRIALDRFHAELEQQSLKESAELYAELYAESEELQQLTEAAIADWPE